MTRRDWRKTAMPLPEGPLALQVWYRSPLWDKDHTLGEDPVWIKDQLAWCGRALDAAREWTDEELGGLWITSRKSAHCAECTRKQTEWDARGKW